MASLNPSDQFLVNRDGASYNVTQENLMAEIQDTDLLLVNRSDISYQVTGLEAKDSFVDPLAINSVTLSNTTPTASESITAVVDLVGGKAPYVYTYVWQYVVSDAVYTVTTTPATTDSYGNYAAGTTTTTRASTATTSSTPAPIPGALNSATYTIPDDLTEVGWEIRCNVTVTDALSGTITKASAYTAPVEANGAPPNIGSATLAKLTPDSPDRFTDQGFTVAVDMISNIPAADFALKGKVLGDLSVDISTSVITGVTSDVVQSGFTPVIYTGNATSTGLTTKVTTGFAPDLVWIKGRTGSAYNHQLYDTLRGQNSGLQM